MLREEGKIKKPYEPDPEVEMLRKALSLYFGNDPKFEKIGKSGKVKSIPDKIEFVGDMDLTKGIAVLGPVGNGKTSFFRVFQKMFYTPNDWNPYQFSIKSCRHISREYLDKEFGGEHIIDRYGKNSFTNYERKPISFCFDDFGSEDDVKRYGNNVNIMAEILQDRYDLISTGMRTHLTTNLTGKQIRSGYGNRIASRFRAMFNQILYYGDDKR